MVIKAEKINDPLIVRETSGDIGFILTAPSANLFTARNVPTTGLQTNFTLTGGGGINFAYDTYLRDDREQPRVPPYDVDGGVIGLTFGIEIQNMAGKSLDFTVTGEATAPLTFTFLNTPNCRFKINCALQKIALGAKVDVSGSEFEIFTIDLYEPEESGIFYEHCFVEE